MRTRQDQVGGERLVRTGQAVFIGIGGYLLALPLSVVGALILCPIP
ncbi:MAG: hypothetical protein ACIARR_01375 [Phycisphaerales bacterium JB059]